MKHTEKTTTHGLPCNFILKIKAKKLCEFIQVAMSLKPGTEKKSFSVHN